MGESVQFINSAFLCLLIDKLKCGGFLMSLSNEAQKLMQNNESKWVRMTRNAFETVAYKEGLGDYFINEYEALASSISYEEFLRRLNQHELLLVIKDNRLYFQSVIQEINLEGLVADRVLTALESK